MKILFTLTFYFLFFIFYFLFFIFYFLFFIFYFFTAKFRPDDMCSQVNQVFIVCRPTISPRTGRKALLVNFVNKKGVPLYHPLLPSPPIFEWDEDDRMVLLLKMINAERAAMCAPVYRTKLRRTRRQMLQNIVDSYQESS